MTTQLLDERFETMPWELIDTVVFDVGNVLLEWNPKKIVAAMYPGNEALQQDRLPDIHDGQNDGTVLVGVCTFCMVGRGAVI